MTRIQLRRGTAVEWTTINPVLSVGEPGYATDEEIFKVGNGTDPWVSLDEFAGAGSGGGGGGYTTDAGDITTGVFATARIPNLDAAKITTGVLSPSRIPPLDASQIGSGTFEPAILPNLDTSKVTTGTFDLARIPALPASKITTGVLDIARIPALPYVSTSDVSVFSTTRIPNLDAARISTGVFNVARIPDLDAAKITTGTINTSRIAGLNASQVTSGVFDPARIPGTPSEGGAVTDAAQIVSGVFATARIPNLDAAKITTGVLDAARIPALPYASTSDTSVFTAARIPDLDTAKITTGVFTTARIPDLDAAKITTGTITAARIPALPYVSSTDVSVFPTSRIPNLDASRISTGVFNAARIPALPYALASDASVFVASRIPTLDASKITTGVFDPARIPPTTVAENLTRNYNNMIVNPGFRSGIAPHVPYLGTLEPWGWYHTSNGSGHFTITSGGLGAVVPNGGHTFFPGPMLGATYEFTFWARTGGGAPSATCDAVISILNDVGTEIQSAYGVTQPISGTSWVQCTTSITISDGSAHSMYPIAYTHSNNINGTFCIDDMVYRQVFPTAGSAPSGGGGGGATDTATLARITSLEQTAATVEEIVVSVSQEGRWAGTPNAWSNAISGAGATYSQTIFTAPYACRVVSFDIVREFGDTPLHASDYLTSQLLNGATAISTKRTVSGTGQAMNSGIPWSHDPATFNGSAVMSKGQRLQAAWTIFGNASIRFPCNYTFRIVPV